MSFIARAKQAKKGQFVQWQPMLIGVPYASLFRIPTSGTCVIRVTHPVKVSLIKPNVAGVPVLELK